MSSPKRIPTGGGQALSHNPFGALSSEGLPPAPENLPDANSGGAGVPAGHLPPANTAKTKKKRGRVDLLPATARSGRQAEMVEKNFSGVRHPEKEQSEKA